jgi:hypothetical protein
MFTGRAFSGGSVGPDFPPLGFAGGVALLSAGAGGTAADSVDFFSVVVGVAEVNALDWAHDGTTNRKVTAMTLRRRFISGGESSLVVQTIYIEKDATRSAGVNRELFEI